MTNEQLKILLMGLYAELGAAIEESRDQIRTALGRPPEHERVHNAAPPFAVCNIDGNCPNADHWTLVEHPASIPEIGPVEAWQALLWDRIEELSP